ncbi:MAG TPA: hypothetical protein DEV93_20890 [Chloroflexi bacterium]|nr:hypothetical protein [Chloroflexota bacterium]
MNTCLVLGAGATLAHALHFHSKRRVASNPPLDHTFFETIRARGIAPAAELNAYAAATPGSNPFLAVPGEHAMRMEEFFRDLFSDFQEDPKLTGAYEQLISLYAQVLRQTTDWIGKDARKGGPVGRLIAAAADVSDSLTIMTFNHDLVIENELIKRARLRRRWCLGQGYGSLSKQLHYNYSPPSLKAVFPLHGLSCDHSRPITVLKLHGSLNWFIRMKGAHPSPDVLSGTSAAPQRIICSPRRGAPSQFRNKRRYSWPVLVPPVHGKEALIRTFLRPVWSDAQTALSTAQRLVFVGYSLPALDVYAEHTFRRLVAANTNDLMWIDVVNPNPESAQRYASLVKPKGVRWCPSIEAFLQLGSL